MNDDLKPCPCCDGKKFSLSWGGTFLAGVDKPKNDIIDITCQSCGLRLWGNYQPVKDRWNTRPAENMLTLSSRAYFQQLEDALFDCLLLIEDQFGDAESASLDGHHIHHTARKQWDNGWEAFSDKAIQRLATRKKNA